MKDQKLIGLLGEIQTMNVRNTSWNHYWSARFLAKTVCWRTYIVHAVYKLLVYFRQRRHLWISSICTCGTVLETDFEGFEFISARHSKWYSALCLLNVNTSSPLAIFMMYMAELCWIPPLFEQRNVRKATKVIIRLWVESKGQSWMVLPLNTS